MRLASANLNSFACDRLTLPPQLLPLVNKESETAVARDGLFCEGISGCCGGLRVDVRAQFLQ